MKVQVVRVGQSNGQYFAEVQHSPDGQHLSALRYSVPVSDEVAIGTVLELTVEVVEVPKAEATAEPTILTHMDVAPLVVPTSPIANEEVEEVDTAPSGQSENDGEEKKLKQGKLPKGFPHQAELEAAGVTTYAQARALNGDYSEVKGIGASKGAEIDAALNE